MKRTNRANKDLIDGDASQRIATEELPKQIRRVKASIQPSLLLTRIYQRGGERGGVLDLLLHEIVEEHHDIRVVDGQLPHYHDVQRHANRPNLHCFRLPYSYVRSVRVVRLLGRALGRVEVHAPRGVVQ